MSVAINHKTATLEELAAFVRACGEQGMPRERGVPEADAYIWRQHAGNLGSILMIVQAVLDRHYPPPEEEGDDASGRQRSTAHSHNGVSGNGRDKKRHTRASSGGQSAGDIVPSDSADPGAVPGEPAAAASEN